MFPTESNSAPFQRLERNIGAISIQEQAQLSQTVVGVIGCGGLGGYVAEMLARMGVGTLHLFDPDVFSPSNCNRQINALETTLGKKKAAVTAARIRDMGTGCTPHAHACLFQDKLCHTEGELHPVPALIVDCLDSIPARFELAQHCTDKAIPLVHGAVHGWCGQVGVQLPGYDLLSQLYPTHKATKKNQQPETDNQAPSVLSCTVSLLASLQANEAIKVLLNISSPLQNNCLQVDLKYGTFDLMPESGTVPQSASPS